MGYACLFALPFQCFFLKRYLWGPGKGRLFYKGAAAFFPVLISLAGAVCFKGDAWLLFAAALLCFLADIWIEYSLVCGVLVFLGAHLCFIFWMAFSGAILSWNLLLAVLFAVLLLWGYGKYLKKLGPTAWFWLFIYRYCCQWLLLPSVCLFSILGQGLGLQLRERGCFPVLICCLETRLSPGDGGTGKENW